jgi:drug/metabolite transporter (DMT)-like permease
MSAFVFGIVLFAALLHAVWNAIVKSADNTVLTTALVTAFAALIAAAVLPFCVQPARESWHFIMISVCLQVIYFTLIGYIYRFSEMSLTYPLMRGTAPLLAALLGIVTLNETLTLQTWIGVFFICGGILSMVLEQWKFSSKVIGLAFLNASVIAGYTLVDGMGVRLSDAPVAYTLWIMLLKGVVLAGWRFILDPAVFIGYTRRYWHFGLIGGTGMMTSYGVALWAMTFSPVVMVAALRETSVLFALMISALFLKEKIGTIKLVSSCLIVAGVIMLRLAS